MFRMCFNRLMASLKEAPIGAAMFGAISSKCSALAAEKLRKMCVHRDTAKPHDSRQNIAMSARPPGKLSAQLSLSLTDSIWAEELTWHKESSICDVSNKINGLQQFHAIPRRIADRCRSRSPCPVKSALHPHHLRKLSGLV